MSDFSALVQKLNDIEENKETSVITESAPSTKPVEIAEAFQALKDAHMYAVKQAEED